MATPDPPAPILVPYKRHLTDTALKDGRIMPETFYFQYEPIHTVRPSHPQNIARNVLHFRIWAIKRRMIKGRDVCTEIIHAAGGATTMRLLIRWPGYSHRYKDVSLLSDGGQGWVCRADLHVRVSEAYGEFFKDVKREGLQSTQPEWVVNVDLDSQDPISREGPADVHYHLDIMPKLGLL